MKNQKGITLIALVVTIVVLLILAGTAIAMLQGDNGIITNAQKSAAANIEGEVIDKIGFAYNSVKAEVITKSSIDSKYDSQETTEELRLAKAIAKEIGLSNSESLVAGGEGIKENGYTVKYTATSDPTPGTVEITYSDTTFDGEPYPVITAKITIKDNNIEYTTQPTRNVK